MGQKKSVVLVGKVAGAFGVKGWVKINSFTHPPENILQYAPWQFRHKLSGEILRDLKLLESKLHGKGLVARISGIADRDKASELGGLEIVVERSQLPVPEDGRYYWTDLEGLQVVAADGTLLGHVDHMLEAGAADVMVVCGDGPKKSRHLIPFIRDEIVLAVDLDAGIIRVNWADNWADDQQGGQV